MEVRAFHAPIKVSSAEHGGGEMVTVPLGIGAYKRLAAAEPEIKLVNRYVEKALTNLREHVALIGRGGTTNVTTATDAPVRGTYCKPGSFNGDLFIAAGASFFRYNDTSGLTQITGTLANSPTNPYVTWMKGLGYEMLFIADGTNFYYYSTNAGGILTLDGAGGGELITDFALGGSESIITINGVYYSWSANVEYNSPAGTSTSPYLANLGSATPDGNGLTYDSSSLSNMMLLINNSGFPGTDYSLEVPGANTLVTAAVTSNTLNLTAIADDSSGNSITTTVYAGSVLSWGASTLTGGGGSALQVVGGQTEDETIKALANVSSYVLASVGGTQKFYWLNPGTTVIDPLNFAEKESSPDNILDMLTVGDQVLIAGNGSMENWYASGNFTAPFVPYEGRVYVRGITEGTMVNVNDSAVFVGNDGVVYEVGYSWGGSQQWGVHRISDYGIEERIRMQLRREAGLTP